MALFDQAALRFAPGVKRRDYGLRWYQQEAKEKTEAALKLVRSALVVMATGMGKTRFAGSLAGDWERGDVLFLAHRDELVQQAARDLEKITGEQVEIEQADQRASARARIVVGSVQSVTRDNRLHRMGTERFGLIIADECFPGDTEVDGHTIRSYRAGDTVTCVDHETGLVCRRRVTRVFKHWVPTSAIVTLRIGATVISCTGNHPFFVKGKGYVEAKNISPGDLCCVRPPFHQHRLQRAASEGHVFECVQVRDLRGDHGAHQPHPCLGAYALAQPDDPIQCAGEDAPDFTEHRSPARCPWGQRDGGDQGGTGDSRCSGLADAGRGSDPDAEGVWVPDLLQDRRGEPGTEGSGGSGWGQPYIDDAPGAGREEGRFLTWVRVDRVASYESSSAGGLAVYNLEVEGCHTYFAGNVLVHNCHHYTAPAFRKPLDFFGNAKLVGITATPDRADEKALGTVFDEVAYLMEINDGIDQGYLVPIRGQTVTLGAIDLSGIDTRAGDLVAGQLDEAMLKAVEGLVQETLRLYPDRSGPAFFPGVKSAEMACQRFNALKPGSAVFLHAKTQEDERRQIVKDVKAGRYQYLCNVGIATEGFDWPAADIVIGGRPTKSRSLYAQMVGRGTRVLPGTVDHIPGKEGAAARRALVAGSAKPNVVVLDFVGNAGKHSLMGPEDLLGGDYTEEEVALAKKMAKPGGGTLQGLEAAREELRRLAHQVKSTVRSIVSTFDPFSVIAVDRDEVARINQRFGYKPATDNQRGALRKFGLKEQDLEALSFKAAGKLMEKFGDRIKRGLASYNQLALLRKNGVHCPDGTTFTNASKAITYLKDSGWRVRDVQRMDAIISGRREPGED